jgi:GTPase SAR1 family protein
LTTKYISTIGVKVSRKVIAVPRGDGTHRATMMLWDLASSEEFTRVRASYLRGSAGAVVICDLTRPETLDSLRRYVDELQMVSPGAPLILAANKRDLIEPSSPEGLRMLDPEQVKAEAASLGAPYYLTSAKTGDEIEGCSPPGPAAGEQRLWGRTMEPTLIQRMLLDRKVAYA